MALMSFNKAMNGIEISVYQLYDLLLCIFYYMEQFILFIGQFPAEIATTSGLKNLTPTHGSQYTGTDK